MNRLIKTNLVNSRTLSQSMILWHFSSSLNSFSNAHAQLSTEARCLIYGRTHTSCVRTVKAFARLRGCAGSPEPSLVAYVISTISHELALLWFPRFSFSERKMRHTFRIRLDRVKRIWYLSPMRAAKVQASLRIRAVSPEPSLLAHTSSESRRTFRQKARSLAPLNGWACAVKICNDGMLEDTKSLDGAQTD